MLLGWLFLGKLLFRLLHLFGDGGLLYFALVCGIIICCLMNLNQVKTLIPAINDGANGSMGAIMNTACAVGKGVVLYCANGNVTEADLAAFRSLMADAGIVDPISEGLIDAGCAITGCGPAFAYMFIEALADGGVKCGLPRAKAIRYAAQMLSGSAEMVLQSGKHPEQLKDDVCSPGGSTIAGVDALEQHGFRGGCIAAVDAAFEKTRQLG
jgi:pyrroline-5-carboxylate reductase